MVCAQQADADGAPAPAPAAPAAAAGAAGAGAAPAGAPTGEAAAAGAATAEGGEKKLSKVRTVVCFFGNEAIWALAHFSFYLRACIIRAYCSENDLWTAMTGYPMRRRHRRQMKGKRSSSLFVGDAATRSDFEHANDLKRHLRGPPSSCTLYRQTFLTLPYQNRRRCSGPPP